MKRNRRDQKNKSSSEETAQMSSKEKYDAKITKLVVDNLKPDIVDLIEVKLKNAVKPIETELKNMQTTFTKEFQALMTEIKAPQTDPNPIPSTTNIIEKGKPMDPMFKTPSSPTPPTQQAPNSGGMDMNKIMIEAMQDHQIPNMLKGIVIK